MRIVFVIVVCVLLTRSAMGEIIITTNGITLWTSGGQVTVNSNTVIVDDRALSNNVVRGSGRIASQDRDLSEFDELHLQISAAVTVVKGENIKCMITTDDNILPVILTKNTNRVLLISAKENYLSRQQVEIAIEIPQLSKLQINGSGSIAVTGILKDEADLVISGSGHITAKGQVKELIATINGSGDLRATDLKAKIATVTINGSGNADVHAAAILSAKVNGSGNITYLGAPSKIRTSVNGSGIITKK